MSNNTPSPPQQSTTHPTLGTITEICIATPSLTTTISELKAFGIGPWKVYTFDTRDNISDATIDARPAHFRLRVGFAQLTRDVAYEVIEPLDMDADTEGEGQQEIFGSWLKARNQMAGVHHVAYDCHNVAWEERMQRFAEMGARFVQGGVWRGKKGTCRFAWFKAGDGKGVGATSTFFETIEFSDDWEDPVPVETY